MLRKFHNLAEYLDRVTHPDLWTYARLAAMKKRYAESSQYYRSRSQAATGLPVV